MKEPRRRLILWWLLPAIMLAVGASIRVTKTEWLCIIVVLVIWFAVALYRIKRRRSRERDL